MVKKKRTKNIYKIYCKINTNIPIIKYYIYIYCFYMLKSDYYSKSALL